ncbi:MAG: DUF1858 domain-containing protein [Bacteroidales bacterium]|nr:DUF1858 domain-containing protein [Bacteroidales bacterium]MBK8884656.1 DUF1858 domain-containing protein [Bacteroidales bacterium]
MIQSKNTISPKTKIGELLDAFPELEPVLIAMSPSFEKLKNPILRRTVAKVATLQQVAIVGGLNIEDLIRQLRKEAGQSDEEHGFDNQEYVTPEMPEWFDITKISGRFDATAKINAGESPMKEILQQTSLLKSGEILELQTLFIPAPIIDMLKEKQFRICTIVNNERVITYISK